MLRMNPDQENKLFFAKCKKEKISPTPELFQSFQDTVMARQHLMESEAHKSYEKERKRRQQRTVNQTIQEDGAIISPVDEKAYVTKRAWDDHIKANNMIEIGNETANKRKKRQLMI